MIWIFPEIHLKSYYSYHIIKQLSKTHLYFLI